MLDTLSEDGGAIYADTLKDREFATTLARGLHILRCFTPDAPALGNKELVERTGLPKATISRFTYTLSRLGYLRQAPGSNKYELAMGVLSLGYPLLATLEVRQLARREMNELASEVGGSVAMGVRERLNMIYIETSRSAVGDSPPFSDIGYAHPIAATSMGRAYLASCEQPVREALLNEIRVKMPDHWQRFQHRFEASRQEYIRLGFCMSFDFYRPGIYGVAVPLPHGSANGETLVLNCAVYADQFSPKMLESQVGPKLAALCRRIESLMRC